MRGGEKGKFFFFFQWCARPDLLLMASESEYSGKFSLADPPGHLFVMINL